MILSPAESNRTGSNLVLLKNIVCDYSDAMQLKYHVYNMQKVQSIAKSTKFGSFVQDLKGPMCVCASGATSIVLSQLKKLDLVFKKNSCWRFSLKE